MSVMLCGVYLALYGTLLGLYEATLVVAQCRGKPMRGYHPRPSYIADTSCAESRIQNQNGVNRALVQPLLQVETMMS